MFGDLWLVNSDYDDFLLDDDVESEYDDDHIVNTKEKARK